MSGARDRERQAAIVLAGGLVLLIVLGLTLGLTARDDVATSLRELDVLGPSPMVRVRLASRDGRALDIRGAEGLRVTDGTTDATVSLPLIRIRTEEGGILVNRRPYSGVVIVTPEDGAPLEVDGTPYPGRLRVEPDSRRGHVFVLEVPLETYVSCVLPREMPLGSAAASLRAQSIATRSYVVATMLARRERSWDVVDTEASQVFGALDRNAARGRRHVEATRGLVLAEGDEVLRSYFAATCGGQTRSNARAFGETERPSLRGVTCGYCNGNVDHRWTLHIPRQNLSADFHVTRVSIDGDAAANAALVLEGPGGERRILGSRRLRRLAAPHRLKSTRLLEARLTADTLIIEGAGFGHRVGLCQNGARAMGRAGRDASQILAHYYPGAEIVRLRP